MGGIGEIKYPVQTKTSTTAASDFIGAAADSVCFPKLPKLSQTSRGVCLESRAAMAASSTDSGGSGNSIGLYQRKTK